MHSAGLKTCPSQWTLSGDLCYRLLLDAVNYATAKVT